MSTDASTRDIIRAQALLAAVGLTAVEVDQCTDDRCPWCEPRPLPLAA